MKKRNLAEKRRGMKRPLTKEEKDWKAGNRPVSPEQRAQEEKADAHERALGKRRRF